MTQFLNKLCTGFYFFFSQREGFSVNKDNRVIFWSILKFLEWVPLSDLKNNISLMIRRDVIFKSFSMSLFSLKNKAFWALSLTLLKVTSSKICNKNAQIHWAIKDTAKGLKWLSCGDLPNWEQWIFLKVLYSLQRYPQGPQLHIISINIWGKDIHTVLQWEWTATVMKYMTEFQFISSALVGETEKSSDIQDLSFTWTTQFTLIALLI